MKKGRGLALYCGGLYAFLYVPLVVMTIFSFNNAHRNVVWLGFTLKWYARLWKDADLMNAMLTSVELAAAAAAIAAVLGVLASYALTRHKSFHGREGYAALLDAP
ncbi:MAG: putrescine ABC transporter permease PotI, partial [Elusimicrobia bacterium]|nr:putrescine ABC transporter permease PotI [Elusimicrobiota bacterium]